MKLIKSLQASLLGLVMVLYQVSAIAGVTYYHNDMLGSPVAATDEAGNVIWRANYYPYGDKETTDNAGNPVAPDNTRYYTGHEHDEETGLTYMQARYYDPVVGRFMGVDNVGFSEEAPSLFNRYSYVKNNPYKYNDPNGEIANFVIGFAIGAGIETFAKVAENGGISGLGWSDAADIAISGLVGSVTGGVGGNLAKSAAKGAISATRATVQTAATGSATNAAGSVASDVANGNDITVGKTTTAAVLGAVGAGGGAKIANSGTAKLQSMGRQAINTPAGIQTRVAEVTAGAGASGASSGGVSLGGVGTDASIAVAQKITEDGLFD